MDPYTVATKKWLNLRFQETVAGGVYFAHQNVYGFKSPFVGDGIALKYLIVCNIVKALKRLRFDSFLDVGGADGYMPALVRKIFNVRVRSCDLSEEACLRAHELYNVEADPVDGVNLPYADGSFDVVLSSETLEHVPRYEAVLRELLRVAKKAVIVTVPHDGVDAIKENIRNKVPHGHIHDFTLGSFKELVPVTYGIQAWGLYSSLLPLAYRLIEGRPIDPNTRVGIRRILIQMVNPFFVFAGKFLNQKAFKATLGLDRFLSNRVGTYRQIVFILAKEPAFISEYELSPNDVNAVLNFKVPLHYLKKNSVSEAGSQNL